MCASHESAGSLPRSGLAGKIVELTALSRVSVFKIIRKKKWWSDGDVIHRSLWM